MRRRFEQVATYGLPYTALGSLGVPTLGNTWWVDPSATIATDAAGTHGQDPTRPLKTVQQAIDNAAARDLICVAPGSYDEAITISKAYLTLLGLGGRGGAAIAPSASNGVAITIADTGASAKLRGITLINVGGEGKGTGGGLLVSATVQGIRQVRAIGCKFEGGAYGVTMKGTGSGISVGDSIFDDCEFAWATDGFILAQGTGGDVVTETWIRKSLFHDITTDGFAARTSAHEQTWLIDNIFANAEGGTAPTKYFDFEVAGQTGVVTGNRFATTVHAAAKMGMQTNILFVGNYAEAEGPATGGGTSGRPD